MYISEVSVEDNGVYIAVKSKIVGRCRIVLQYTGDRSYIETAASKSYLDDFDVQEYSEEYKRILEAAKVLYSLLESVDTDNFMNDRRIKNEN